MAPDTSDRWAEGDAYERYMGRWSRLVAREFLDWLGPRPGSHWLEVGCGTGALTSSIAALCEPASIVACDQSASFVEHARSRSADARIEHVTAGADSLPSRADGFDVIVSGLVVNFIPAPERAVSAMRERVHPDGIVAAYVWDYDGGVEFLRHFWEEAVALDPQAADLDEARRFRTWTLPYLATLFEAAGLVAVETAPLSVPTTFDGFDDYWAPFLGATGPAPGYVASLPRAERERLAERLKARLPSAGNGSIRLHARALAVRGVRA